MVTVFIINIFYNDGDSKLISLADLQYKEKEEKKKKFYFYLERKRS